MNRNRKTANLLSGFLFIATCAVAWIFFTYLPDSPERLRLTIGIAALGIISAVVLHVVVTKLPDKRWVRIAMSLMFGLLALSPLLSVWRQRITYSRFGFTLYGTIPIPVLDITINRHGVLWFREKTHQITRQELDALVSSDVEIIIVGIGWDSIARLTDEANQISTTIDLRVLPTPAAFALFNQLKAEGRKVVLLAHCTC